MFKNVSHYSCILWYLNLSVFAVVPREMTLQKCCHFKIFVLWYETGVKSNKVKKKCKALRIKNNGKQMDGLINSSLFLNVLILLSALAGWRTLLRVWLLSHCKPLSVTRICKFSRDYLRKTKVERSNVRSESWSIGVILCSAYDWVARFKCLLNQQLFLFWNLLSFW